MSDTATAPAAAAPSAPSAPSTPSTSSSTPSSTPNTSSRQTTADIASKLYGANTSSPDVAPTLESQLETPDAQTATESEVSWHERLGEVHGLKAQEILEALQNGEVPQALYDKLRFTLKDGDFESDVDLHTLHNGAMMQSAFTRKTQELAEERRNFQSEYNEFAEYLRGWKTDPQQMLYGMERMELPILEVAKLLAERLTYADQLNAAVPGSGDKWMVAEKNAAKLADLERAQARSLEQAEAAKTADKRSKVQAQLQNVSKEVFAKIGLELEESSWNAYSQHVQAIYDAKPAGQQKLTKQDLERAARATKAQFDRYAQEYAARKPKKAPGLGTAPLDAGAPKSVPSRAPAKPGQKTTEQFLADMRNRQGIRQR